MGQHQISASESANCANNSVNFLTVLNSPSRKETNIKMLQKWGLAEKRNAAGPADSEIDDEEILNLQSIILDFSFSNNLERCMISYTAAVLQNDIIQGKWYWRLKCERCLCVFSEDDTIDDELVDLKLKTTNLRPVARSTFDICVASEELMKKFDYDPKYYDKIQSELLRILNIKTLFPYMCAETNHKQRLIELVIKMYVKKRQLYISRINTLEIHDIFYRNKLKKVVHFQGQ